MTTSKTIHHLGDGWEDHVDESDGVITYSIPVASGMFERSFDFVLTRDQLEVLVADRWRRVVLFHVLHTLLQRTMVRGLDAPMDQDRFARVVDEVLVSSRSDAEVYVDRFSTTHNIALRGYVERDLA